MMAARDIDRMHAGKWTGVNIMMLIDDIYVITPAQCDCYINL